MHGSTTHQNNNCSNNNLFYSAVCKYKNMLACFIHTLHSNNAPARLILNRWNTDICYIFGIKVRSSCLDEVIMDPQQGRKDRACRSRSWKRHHYKEICLCQAPIQKGGCRATVPHPTPSNAAKINLKNTDIFMRDDIKWFTWLILKPKSANKTSWLVAHWNVWK